MLGCARANSGKGDGIKSRGDRIILNADVIPDQDRSDGRINVKGDGINDIGVAINLKADR